MEKKSIEIQAINGIGYNGSDYQPGQCFDCETKEAERLVKMGVACYPVPPAPVAEPVAPPVVDNSELLVAIAAAETVEALAALMPAEKPADEVIAAFDARMLELEQ